MSFIAIFVILFLVALAVGIIFYLRRTGHLLYVILSQEQVMVIERLGRFHRVIDKGFHFLIPFIDRPRRMEWRYPYQPETGEMIPTLVSRDRLTLQQSMVDIPPQAVITKDNASVTIDCLFFVKIIEPRKVVYEIENFPLAIAKLTETKLRNIVGNMTLDDLNASRDNINDLLRANMKETTDQWGVELQNVQIQSISPPKELADAMQQQAIQERKKRVTITEAEAFKQAEINRAEGQKRSMELQTDAEVLMLRKISELMGNHEAASQYLATLRYVEAFKELVSKKDGKVVFVPYESSNLMSSLGMVREFFESEVGGSRRKPESIPSQSDKTGKSESDAGASPKTEPETGTVESEPGMVR